MFIVEVLCECGKLLFIDIYKFEVMCVMLDVGVDLINDIWGFCWFGVIEVVVKGDVGLCVMYMQCDLEMMQELFSYVDLMGEVEIFLCV